MGWFVVVALFVAAVRVNICRSLFAVVVVIVVAAVVFVDASCHCFCRVLEPDAHLSGRVSQRRGLMDGAESCHLFGGLRGCTIAFSYTSLGAPPARSMYLSRDAFRARSSPVSTLWVEYHMICR